MIVVPLLDIDQATGKKIEYWDLSRAIEKNVRGQYETKDGPYKVRVIGFAKIIGSLLDGLLQVMMYFGVAILIAAAILYSFTRCVRSTFVVLLCSLIAVIWQIGILRLIGLGLDPPCRSAGVGAEAPTCGSGTASPRSRMTAGSRFPRGAGGASISEFLSSPSRRRFAVPETSQPGKTTASGGTLARDLCRFRTTRLPGARSAPLQPTLQSAAL